MMLEVRDIVAHHVPERGRRVGLNRHEGDAIETRYGTCIVSRSDPSPDGDPHTGKVICRFPGSPS